MPVEKNAGSPFSDPMDVIRARRARNARSRNRSTTPSELDFEFDSGFSEREPRFVPLTPGDPEVDAALVDHFPQYQFSSASAETSLHDARTRASNALQDFGHLLDSDAREQLEAIAATGQPPAKKNPFFRFLDLLDTPGELIRAGIAKATGADERLGADLDFEDFFNILFSNEDALREKYGDQIGEGDFLFEGSRMLDAAGMEPGFARGALGFLTDVLTDPLTYVSFGTAGVGRRMAMSAMVAPASNSWRAAVSAIKKGGKAVDELADPIQKRAAAKIQNRITKQHEEAVAAYTQKGGKNVGEISQRESDLLLRRETRKVLAEEDRVASILQGQKLSDIDDFTNRLLGDLGEGAPQATAIAEEVSGITKLIAEKRYRDIYDLFPEYMQSGQVAAFAKGGLKLAFPFYRNSMPMISIGGALNGPGARLTEKFMKVLGADTQKHLRNVAERFSPFRRDLAAAKSLDKANVSAWTDKLIGTERFRLSQDGMQLTRIVGPTRQAIESLRATGERVGIEHADSERIVRRILEGDSSALQGLPDDAAEEFLDTAVGIRNTLETIHGIAERSGMRLGHIADYVPMLPNQEFRSAMNKLAEFGHAIDPSDATDEMTRLGLELINEFVAQAGGGAQTAVRRLGESVHAQSRKATQKTVSPAAGATELQLLDLRKFNNELLQAGRLGYWDHDTLNEAITKGLQLLADQQKVDVKTLRSLDGAPFLDDLADLLDVYFGSMEQAIKLHDTAHFYRQRAKLIDEPERVSKSRTIAGIDPADADGAHPIGQFVDNLAEALEEGGLAKTVDDVAAKKETVRIKGRTKSFDIEVPAAVAQSRQGKRVVARLAQKWRQVEDNAVEAAGIVDNHIERLIREGFPEDAARSIAILEADHEFVDILGELQHEGRLMAAEIEQVFADHLAANAGRMTNAEMQEQAARAVREAAEVKRGTDEAISQFREGLADKLRVRAARVVPGKANDVPPEMLIRTAEKVRELADAADAASPKASVTKAVDEVTGEFDPLAQPHIVDKTMDVLIEDVDLVDLTVADLVEFSGPSRAATTLVHLWDKLKEGQLDEIADSLLHPDVIRALRKLEVDGMRLADSVDGKVVMALDDPKRVATKKELRAAERASEKALAEVAATHLTGNLSLIADGLEMVRFAPKTLVDPLLYVEFNEVAAASLHKLNWIGRSKKDSKFWAEVQADVKAKGLPKASQRALFEQNSKSLMRTKAAEARLYRVAMAAKSAEELGLGHVDKAIEKKFEKALRMMLNPAEHANLHIYEDEVRAAWAIATGQTMDEVMDKLFIRPNGSVVWVQDITERPWVTLEDVMGDLRQMVPGAESMDDIDVLSRAVEAWRLDPESVENISDTTRAWFGQLDAGGGFDEITDSYELLRAMSDEITLQLADATAEAKRLGRSTKPTPGELRLEAGAQSLSEVLDAVDRTARSAGVGSKGLINVWEKHAETLKRAFPAADVDRVRTLVDYTIGVRSGRLPASVGRAQMKLRRHLWQPLDEAYARMQTEVDDLVAEAAATANDELADIADLFRDFQDLMVKVQNHADSTARRPAAGRIGQVGDDDEFVALVDELRSVGLEAVETARDLPEGFLADLVPPNYRNPDAFLARVEKQMAQWEPVRVATTDGTEGFVNLSTRGIAGEVFGDTLADVHVATLLESMVGHLQAFQSPLGIRMMADNMRVVERWWRSAATVARPTFVPRNLVGGFFNGTIIGVGPKHYAFAARHIVPAVSRIRRGLSTFDDEIANAAPRARAYLEGIRNTDVLATSFSETSLHHLRREVPVRVKLNPASGDNVLFKAGARFMETSEDLLRAAAFVKHFDPRNPATAGMARDLTMVVHFDYSDLTGLERKIKKIAPFFTWTRNNIPLQLRTMFEKPGVYTRWNHLLNNIEDQQGNNVADDFGFNAFQGAFAVPLNMSLGAGSERWTRFVFDPDLPFRDIEEMLGSVSEGGIGGGLEWALNSVSPVISLPFEIAFGDDYEVNAPTGFATIARFFGGQEALDGTVRVDNRAANAFRTSIPFFQEYAEIAGIVPNNPNTAARLGFDTSDGVDPGERARAGVLRVLRSLGLDAQVPGDSRSAAFDATSIVDDILADAKLRGQVVEAGDRDLIIDEILRRAGVPAP